MRSSEIANRIRAFVVEEHNLADDDIIQNDTNLLDAGLLDSLLVVAILAFCEDEFGCELPMEDLAPENFQSVATIAELVQKNSSPEDVAD